MYLDDSGSKPCKSTDAVWCWNGLTLFFALSCAATAWTNVLTPAAGQNPRVAEGRMCSVAAGADRVCM